MLSDFYEIYGEPIRNLINSKNSPKIHPDEIFKEAEYYRECVQDFFNEGYLPGEDYNVLMSLLHSHWNFGV